MKILEKRLNYNSSTTLGGKTSRVKVKSKLDTRISIISYTVLPQHTPWQSEMVSVIGSDNCKPFGELKERAAKKSRGNRTSWKPA